VVFLDSSLWWIFTILWLEAVKQDKLKIFKQERVLNVLATMQNNLGTQQVTIKHNKSGEHAAINQQFFFN